MITKSGARKALAKRRSPPVEPLQLRADFPEQNAFVNDPSRFIVGQCSRRSGKTNGLALRFFNTLARYPGSQCVYLALTLDSARDIFWPVLQELNDFHKLGCTFLESKLIMSHPNGAKLKLYGADMANFVKRLKGRKFPGVAIDESQDFSQHLQSLIDDVLTPSIADYPDGWISLTGTPGPVPFGFFFDITQAGKHGYSVHRWTMNDNPYMPAAEKFIQDLKAKRGWDETNPTLRREYRNEWVQDLESLWIRYSEKLNHYNNLPDTKRFNYILGIDIGFKDADALAVLGWDETSKSVYLVEEVITTKQGISELADQILALQKKYDFSKMVMDEGGLGKKCAEELRRRYSLPIHPAEKTEKQTNVELLNDSLRLGVFKAKADSRFAKDSYLVQIDWDKSTPNRIIIKKKPHSDIIDSVLYAFKESPAYAYQAPTPKPLYGTKAWQDAQALEMFEAERDKLMEEAAKSQWMDHLGFSDD